MLFWQFPPIMLVDRGVLSCFINALRNACNCAFAMSQRKPYGLMDGNVYTADRRKQAKPIYPRR